MAAGITTHVLDVALGKPAAGMQIELFDVGTQPPTLIARTRTNRDGRTDSPILPAAQARTSCRFDSRSPTRRSTITCPCSVRRGASGLIAGVDSGPPYKAASIR
jgi:hypothetical protein